MLSWRVGARLALALGYPVAIYCALLWFEPRWVAAAVVALILLRWRGRALRMFAGLPWLSYALVAGSLLLAVGALVATGRLHGRRKQPVPAGNIQPGAPQKEKKDNWAERMLAEPRLGLAMLIGAVCGIPGAAYLTGLHILITSKSSTANQIIGVILFVLIEFLLIIIPFAFLELRPEATKAFLKRSQQWLAGHTRQLIAYTTLILGAYLAVSALVRLG